MFPPVYLIMGRCPREEFHRPTYDEYFKQASGDSGVQPRVWDTDPDGNPLEKVFYILAIDHTTAGIAEELLGVYAKELDAKLLTSMKVALQNG